MQKILPERILSDLPVSVQKKILNHEVLDSNDCRVAKSYLEKTIIHPESTCDSVIQVVSLLQFYMAIHAKIPQSTLDYIRTHLSDEAFLADLERYDNITSVIQVCMNTLPMKNTPSSLLSFCHINSDKGFRRWNLYAENYGKLMKSVKRWCEFEATHLRADCEYVLYLDEFHIGDIKKGKLFTPNPSSDMYPFIIQFFEQPIQLVMKFTLKENERCGIKSFNFECRVCGDLKYSAMLVLPANPEMKCNMVRRNMIDVSKKMLDITRFQESMSCDIEGELFLNDNRVGVVDLESGEPRFDEKGEALLHAYCGMTEQAENQSETCDKSYSLSLFQRIRNAMLGMSE
ncbi:hypothetical protein [Photobacterium galatheae]|uniref:Uncharacterized protein n=1 Tax=Photobacterium galatheae TaxID=1654360 RepID=A0A066RPC4_9GAMM|nr:hypothetical protein [Photobacterium galatheae]KDM90981.1 hypothetical protein EA58_14615 [Photobacterium galatheae]MCM0149062.1 hypothetical protein [Photobacterium galatheae]